MNKDTINIGIPSKGRLKNDTLNIFKKKKLRIYSNGDHRVAIAFFCLGLLLKGKVEIKNFETVNTSFPKFLFTMKKIGATFEVKKKN